jgi:hypothetical protein
MGKPAVAPPAPIPHEKIAMRAYEKWCQRGCSHGRHEQDWLEAERELRQESTQAAKAPMRR